MFVIYETRRLGILIGIHHYVVSFSSSKRVITVLFIINLSISQKTTQHIAKAHGHFPLATINPHIE